MFKPKRAMGQGVAHGHERPRTAGEKGLRRIAPGDVCPFLSHGEHMVEYKATMRTRLQEIKNEEEGCFQNILNFVWRLQTLGPAHARFDVVNKSGARNRSYIRLPRVTMLGCPDKHRLLFFLCKRSFGKNRGQNCSKLGRSTDVTEYGVT